MNPFSPDIPPHGAEVIRSLHPDLKRSIKSAVRAIAADPECGTPLKRELDGPESIAFAAFALSMPSIRKHELFA